MDRLGFRVAPVHGHVVLAGAPAAVPAGAAPVFEVFADGAVALRRPPPLAPRPGDAATTAAVLLPVARFAELGPAARATALDLVGCLCGERPVPPAVVRADGFAVSDAERSAWLGWLP